MTLKGILFFLVTMYFLAGFFFAVDDDAVLQSFIRFALTLFLWPFVYLFGREVWR